MKKTLLASTIIAILAVTASPANASASKEENIGFLSGALTGAAIGGPFGFIIGGISGVLMGEQVDKANQLEQTKNRLVAEHAENDAINQQLVALKAQISNSALQSIKAADWITQGLILNLMFTTSSTNLSDDDLLTINRLSQLLSEYPELNIHLDGHSDARGDEDSNMALSEARIKAVEQVFASNGIDSTRVNISAHGEAESLETSSSLDNYAMDRRVSIQFYTKKISSVAQN